MIYAQGLSKAKYPNSKHHTTPSDAFDFMPDPIVTGKIQNSFPISLELSLALDLPRELFYDGAEIGTKTEKSTTEKLLTCRNELQVVAHEAIKLVDFSIIHGYRTQEQQDLIYAQGFVS